MKAELITRGFEGRNEDYCKVVELEGHTLAVMADGMGGLSLGEEAAACVCDSLAEYVANNMGSDDLWHNAFSYADNKLRELSVAKRSNMGAAVTALIVSDSSFEVAWQGNVRLYVRRGGVDGRVAGKPLFRCMDRPDRCFMLFKSVYGFFRVHGYCSWFF